MNIRKLSGIGSMALVIIAVGVNFGFAELTKEDVTEVRKIVKEEIKTLRDEMNDRFEELRSDMNARFESIEGNISSNFSWLYILLAAIIALNGTMVGAVVWLARQDKPVTQRHYKKILEREDKLEEELSAVSRKVELHLSTAHAS